MRLGLIIRIGFGHAAIATVLIGCTSSYAPHQVEGFLGKTLSSAKVHHNAGDGVEAAQLVDMIMLVDEGFPGARDLHEELQHEGDYLFRHPLLGVNFSIRPEVERSITAKVLLYLPDRILDLLDVFSLDLHVGLGLYGNVHVTRAAQLGGGARGTAGLGWHEHRSLGGLGQGESGLTVLGFGAQAYSGSIAGTSGVYAVNDTLAGFHRPSANFYQRMRDYWAVGFGVTLINAGVDFGIHPVEFGDFFAGFLGVDFLNDDFAQTRRLRLTRADRTLVRKLQQIERSDEVMRIYQASLDRPLTGDTPPVGADKETD